MACDEFVPCTASKIFHHQKQWYTHMVGDTICSLFTCSTSRSKLVWKEEVGIKPEIYYEGNKWDSTVLGRNYVRFASNQNEFISNSERKCTSSLARRAGADDLSSFSLSSYLPRITLFSVKRRRTTKRRSEWLWLVIQYTSGNERVRERVTLSSVKRKRVEGETDTKYDEKQCAYRVCG